MWHKILIPDFLTPEIFGQINDNFVWLKNKVLEAEGKTVNIQNVSTITHNTPIEAILPYFNAVEQNIQAFYKASTYCRENYVKFTWTADTKNKYEQVRRWVLWFNSAYKNYANIHEEALQDINLENIVDINGEQIYTIERK